MSQDQFDFGKSDLPLHVGNISILEHKNQSFTYNLQANRLRSVENQRISLKEGMYEWRKRTEVLKQLS